ncbi:serine/threonine-protein kinase pim-2-like [Salminus brasiliensis]|uniref:serine/threonine-protein kinase pim-2-like n=1 Tax=Salminus brasiliensis TaxID=930266 RepID=UPI003B82D4A8
MPPFLLGGVTRDIRRRKRRRQEEVTQQISQGTSEVPKPEAPAGKRRKVEVSRPTITTRRQRKALKPDTFSSLYITGEKLGEGGFGSVFEGTRVADGLQVAIKFVIKQADDEYVQCPVELKAVPIEVALMKRMSQPPISSIIKLIEWFDEPKLYILILERPDPCMDLNTLIALCGGSFSEEIASQIMVQAVEAARTCHKRGVLHRDIKLENFLFNMDTSELKLIDFGCGDWIKKSGYRDFSGTFQYCPPEFFLKGRYYASPATVWSLGVLLFRLVNGHLPFTEEQEIVEGPLCFREDLSNECCSLIRSCLQRNPAQRPKLHQILQHDWFQCSSPTQDQVMEGEQPPHPSEQRRQKTPDHRLHRESMPPPSSASAISFPPFGPNGHWHAALPEP